MKRSLLSVLPAALLVSVITTAAHIQATLVRADRMLDVRSCELGQEASELEEGLLPDVRFVMQGGAVVKDPQ